MKYYFAPMEGITGYVYRNAHHKYFSGIGQYFTPFITPNQTRKLTPRELHDVLPEHNREIPVVPQILTNKAEDFIWAAGRLGELGYREVNLNLGCPSGTVVSKNRGSGFLAFPVGLDKFLGAVSRELCRMDMKLSVKTRIGKNGPEEFGDLLRIFNCYPLEKLIIHPRVQTDFYKNHPNLETFLMAAEESVNPVCYNGDLFSVRDVQEFTARFPNVEALMFGRGALTNPALPEMLELAGDAEEAEDIRQEMAGQPGGEIIQARTGQPARGTNQAKTAQPPVLDKTRLKAFHDEVLAGYREAIPGDKNVMFKMKELWFYLGDAFEDSAKPVKKIKKAQRLEDYQAEVERLFASCALAAPPVFHGR